MCDVRLDVQPEEMQELGAIQIGSEQVNVIEI